MSLVVSSCPNLKVSQVILICKLICDQNKMILQMLFIKSDFFEKWRLCWKSGYFFWKWGFFFLKMEIFFIDFLNFFVQFGILLFNLGIFSLPQVVFKSPYDFIRFHRFLKLDILLFIYFIKATSRSAFASSRTKITWNAKPRTPEFANEEDWSDKIGKIAMKTVKAKKSVADWNIIPYKMWL